MIDYKKELFANAYKQRIPLIATIEIVSECNFRCVHCYIDEQYRKDILSYDEIVEFGNQIISMGCMYIVLTGGEVLLHPEFEKIYSFFIQKGTCVSVLTNGSLIKDSIISLFKKYPPRVVEITMYGFSSDTYKQVTKTNNYELVKNNVLLLKENGINVLLKMFVLNENFCDFNSIRSFALNNKMNFKFDTMIIAKNGTSEYSHQIREDIVLDMDISRTTTNIKFNEEVHNYIVDSRVNKLYQCGAGRSSCWLKSSNKLRICNFLSCLEYDLNKYSVREAWNLISDYIDYDVPKESECHDCTYRNYCSYCPAKSYVLYGRTEMIFHDELFCKNAISRALDNTNRR